jgi:predicted SAM-dependent methyltransferase
MNGNSPGRRTLLDGKRLHIGAGPVQIDGWTNIDNLPYPGVHHVLDVTQGLPFENVEFIFAEHFIEHLSYNQGLNFLRECRRALGPNGVLRLSTPNLDWVWATQYHLGQWTEEKEKVRDCFWMNKAFRAWGHQFLYNLATLRETLIEAGFGFVETASYGESRHEALRNLERHEKYVDDPNLPHIVVVEASGIATAPSEILPEPLADYRGAIDVK